MTKNWRILQLAFVELEIEWVGALRPVCVAHLIWPSLTAVLTT